MNLKTKTRFSAGLTGLTLVLGLAAPAAWACGDCRGNFAGLSPLEWSVASADSEIARAGDKYAWRPGRNVTWDYPAGLFTLALLKLDQLVPDPQFVEFSKDTIGSFVTKEGNLRGYELAEYNLAALASGRTVIALYDLTQEVRYQKCAALLRKQLETQPRTRAGGFWRQQRHPAQMWLDDLYLGASFYAEYAKRFEPTNAAAGDDVVQQFRLINAQLYDAKTGLYFHGWDETRAQTWANRTTGASSNFWARGVGWYAMACVDALEFLPKHHPGRAELIATLQQVCDGIVKWQDKESGLWWQVLDQGGRAKNFRDATAASMFVYAMAKGVNDGCLDRARYTEAIETGYNSIIHRLMKRTERGEVSLTSCGAGAGLGDGRGGSYEDYVRDPVVYNDLTGVGTFILAGIEMQKLKKLPMRIQRRLRDSAAAPAKPTAIKEWLPAYAILGRIKAPIFPDAEFPITKYGATADGRTDASAAIARAINACTKAGGGRVVVPAGEYLTGPIQLQSGVNLQLDRGATLKFKTDPKAYLPAVRSWFEGMECFNYSPLIYAFAARDIAITGEGVLDGRADESNWWSWRGRQQAARDRLIAMVEQGRPVAERKFGAGDFLRPSFIETFRCQNVLIEEVRIARAPMWGLHPVQSTNVIVRGVHFESQGPDNDGCAPEACRDVLIEDCVFDTGGDCIALKSGRNEDGRRIGLPTENVVIRRCTMTGGSGGVTIGSEISGGCRNVFVEDCVMAGPNPDHALRIKSNARRGGVVENIFVRNVNVGTLRAAALQIDFLYEAGASGSNQPVVRNLVIENLTVTNAPRVLDVQGLPGAEISGVRILSSRFQGVTDDDVVKAAEVKLENCVIERKP